MPVSSKAQWRYMGAVASGKVKSKGLSPEEARKMLHESRGSYGKLPSMAMNNMDRDAEGAGDKDSAAVRKAEYGGMGKKFGKDTNARVPAKKKTGKKMSRADFMKMVREKKFASKKKK